MAGGERGMDKGPDGIFKLSVTNHQAKNRQGNARDNMLRSLNWGEEPWKNPALKKQGLLPKYRSKIHLRFSSQVLTRFRYALRSWMHSWTSRVNSIKSKSFFSRSMSPRSL